MSDSEAWILIVDDAASACDVLRRVLVQMGHRAVCVHSGAEALARLLRSPPCSLVLLDLNMPEMDGFDVMRAIQADPELWKTPVVICSAADRAAHWPELRALGARDFLTKGVPNFIAELEAIVLRHVGLAAPAHRLGRPRAVTSGKRSTEAVTGKTLVASPPPAGPVGHAAG